MNNTPADQQSSTTCPSPNPAPPSPLEKMFDSACCVCDNILDFQPDLLLCLMHSGWGPTFAAQTLLQHTQTQLFPPVARSNLGLEKSDIYDQDHRVLFVGSFMGHYAHNIDVGRFLAWLTTRLDWQEQLRRQVEQALQSNQAPRRILVVDDQIFEGHTHILTVGLLNLLYPHCEVRFLDTGSWYRGEYDELLLEAIGPLAKPLPERNDDSKEFYKHLDQVAVGSEDITIDSLAWRPITPESEALRALLPYHTAGAWLRASQRVYETIAAYITEQSAAYIQSNVGPYRFQGALPTKYYLLRDIWLEDSLTPRQARQRYGLSPQELRRLLGNELRFDQVVLTGHGRGARYIIQPCVRRHLEGLGDYPYEEDDYYWLIPEKLIIGPRPWYCDEPDTSEEMRLQIRELLDYGVDCWLDVQIIVQGAGLPENPHFEAEGKAIGRDALLVPVPLPIENTNWNLGRYIKPRRPNRKDIRPILDLLDHHLAQGRVIYLSSDEYLRGILAGCYLARHGQSGAAALKALQARRATGPNGWKREPPFDEARRYIRSWPAGL